jgi:predicted DNA-binding transcriptional regulator AlpA
MNPSNKHKPKPLVNEPSLTLIDGTLAKDEEWLTTEDVMKHLNLSKSSVYRLRVKKQIPAFKLGGIIVYPKSLINKILLNNALKGLDPDADSKV